MEIVGVCCWSINESVNPLLIYVELSLLNIVSFDFIAVQRIGRAYPIQFEEAGCGPRSALDCPCYAFGLFFSADGYDWTVYLCVMS